MESSLQEISLILKITEESINSVISSKEKHISPTPTPQQKAVVDDNLRACKTLLESLAVVITTLSIKYPSDKQIMESKFICFEYIASLSKLRKKWANTCGETDNENKTVPPRENDCGEYSLRVDDTKFEQIQEGRGFDKIEVLKFEGKQEDVNCEEEGLLNEEVQARKGDRKELRGKVVLLLHITNFLASLFWFSFAIPSLAEASCTPSQMPFYVVLVSMFSSVCTPLIYFFSVLRKCSKCTRERMPDTDFLILLPISILLIFWILLLSFQYSVSCCIFEPFFHGIYAIIFSLVFLFTKVFVR